MKKILLDTSVIIDFLRQKDKEKTVMARIVQSDMDLFISIITHTELYAGKSAWGNETARKELEILLSGVEILNLDERISTLAGKIRAKYNKDLFDAIIAATAAVHDLKLATINLKDFENIKEVHILNVV